MAANPQFRDSVLEKLAPLGEISSRSMFGGFGIFAEGAMFALIAGSALFFKVDGSNLRTYEEAGSKKYGSMPYYRVPEAILDDDAKLLAWARSSIAVALSGPQKKRR